MAFDRIEASEQTPEADLLDQQTPLRPPLTDHQRGWLTARHPVEPVDEANRCEQHQPGTPTGRIRTTASDDWRAAIELRGELDLVRAAELRSELQRHLDAGRRIIRIDTARLTFIDSTIINELLTASARCQREHGALILTHVPPRIRRIITLTGLDNLLLIDTAAPTPEPGST